MPRSENTAPVLAANVGSLTGLLVLLHQVWDDAAIEHVLAKALGAGAAVYLVLVVGYVGVRYVATLAPPDDEDSEDTPADTPALKAASEEDAPPAAAPASAS